MRHDLHRLATRQHGVVARRQLVGPGDDGDWFDGLVRRGRLRRVARGVHAVAGAPRTLRQGLMVASLRCGPGARVAGEAVLAAAGLGRFAADGPFVVLLRPGRRVRNVPWRLRELRGGEAAVAVDGIPSVALADSLLEAVVDAGDGREVRRLVDAYRWARGDVDDVMAALARSPHHPAAAILHAQGLSVRRAPESDHERRLARILDPLRAEPQVEVDGVGRVDFLVRSLSVVVEFDGWMHDTPWAREHDDARDDLLRGRGLGVVRVRAPDLDAPAEIVARIATESAGIPR